MYHFYVKIKQYYIEQNDDTLYNSEYYIRDIIGCEFISSILSLIHNVRPDF